MRNKPGFDEVMIVNPAEPGANQGVRLMRVYPPHPLTMGYYAQAPQSGGYYGGYGYYAEPPPPLEPPLGYYADPAELYGYYGEPVQPQVPLEGYYGYYGEPVQPQVPLEGYYGYYGEPAQPTYPLEGYYGYYDEPAQPTYPLEGYYSYYGEPPQPSYPVEGYYGNYGEPAPAPLPLEGYYGSFTEMPGYAQYARTPESSGVSYYGEPDLAGYLRAHAPTYNAGCPMPTNVAGFAEAAMPLDGYVKPSSVNAECEQLTPQPASGSPASEYFKPLW